MKGYFENSLDSLVRDVKVLVYVFDLSEEEKDFEMSVKNWGLILSNIEKYNDSMKVFVLLNKSDLLTNTALLPKIVKKKEERILSVLTVKKLKVKQFFPTSILTESIYLAWSTIVHDLIPFQ